MTKKMKKKNNNNQNLNDKEQQPQHWVCARARPPDSHIKLLGRARADPVAFAFHVLPFSMLLLLWLLFLMLLLFSLETQTLNLFEIWKRKMSPIAMNHSATRLKLRPFGAEYFMQ
jgi:hypothetical protein